MAETVFPLNTGATIPALGFGEFLLAFEIDRCSDVLQARGKPSQER